MGVGRQKKYENRVGIITYMDIEKREEIRKRIPNFSEWVNDRVDEFFAQGNTLAEFDKKALEAEAEQKKAILLAEEKKKEVEVYRAQAELLRTPTKTILSAQNILLTQAIDNITNRLNEPDKALDLAKEWSRALGLRGMNKTPLELIKMAEGSKTRNMYR